MSVSQVLLLSCVGLAVADVRVPVKVVAPGVRMPVLSIGTGGLESRDAGVIVKTWLGLGGRGIDTAQIYRNQEAVAAAVAAAGVNRSSVFITTKVMGCQFAGANVEADLQKLGTDYIDLLLIHFPFPPSSCTAAWAALEDLYFKGTLKAIGVSNFKSTNLRELLRTARVTPAVNQIQHNVLEHDDETVTFSVKNNITVEAYSPLGRSGHSGDIADNPVLKAVAASYNVSTYQVALRWIIQHGHILTFQSSSGPHQQSDADIFNFSLSDVDMARLDCLQSQPRGDDGGVLLV